MGGPEPKILAVQNCVYTIYSHHFLPSCLLYFLSSILPVHRDEYCAGDTVGFLIELPLQGQSKLQYCKERIVLHHHDVFTVINHGTCLCIHYLNFKPFSCFLKLLFMLYFVLFI